MARESLKVQLRWVEHSVMVLELSRVRISVGSFDLVCWLVFTDKEMKIKEPEIIENERIRAKKAWVALI